MNIIYISSRVFVEKNYNLIIGQALIKLPYTSYFRVQKVCFVCQMNSLLFLFYFILSIYLFFKFRLKAEVASSGTLKCLKTHICYTNVLASLTISDYHVLSTDFFFGRPSSYTVIIFPKKI